MGLKILLVMNENIATLFPVDQKLVTLVHIYEPDILKSGSRGVGIGPGVSSGRSFLRPATTRGAGDCSPTSIALSQHCTLKHFPPH